MLLSFKKPKKQSGKPEEPAIALLKREGQKPKPIYPVWGRKKNTHCKRKSSSSKKKRRHVKPPAYSDEEDFYDFYEEEEEEESEEEESVETSGECFSELVLDHEPDTTSIEPLPAYIKGQRYACYVSGISGSGKSTAIRNLLDHLRKANKKSKVYLFSAIKEFDDPAFKGLKISHLKYDDKETLFQLKPEHLRDSIILCDDWDQSLDKSVTNFMRGLLKSLLETGRKMNIQLFIVSHQTQDYLKTRDIINECSSFQLFPAANRNSVLRFAKAYLDLNKKQMDRIAGLNYGRFTSLYVTKSIPRYMVSNKMIAVVE